MIISPWAMLMTPMTPKVMASPIAASSRTEPRLTPWKMLAAISIARLRWAITRSASAAAALISAASAVSATSPSSRRISGSLESARVAIAFNLAGMSPDCRVVAARAKRSASATPESFSAASACSSTGAPAGSGWWSTARAASSRWARSGLNRLSRASAASISPRSRLLTLIRSGSPPSSTAAPVSGSTAPESLAITTRLSPVTSRVPSVSARRITMARGSPDAPKVSIARARSSKPPAARSSSAGPRSAAHAAKGSSVSDSSNNIARTPRTILIFFESLLITHIFRLGAIAADPGEGPIRGQLGAFRDELAPGIGLDRLLGLPDDVELPVRLDFADHHRLREMMVGVHHRFEAARRLDFLADHRLADGIDIGRAGLEHGLGPHVEADICGLHRVVGGALVVLDIGVPLFDEGRVFRRFHRLEVVPGGELADQILGVDAGQFLFADREGHHRQILGLDPLVRQLLVEGHVGVAVDGRDDTRLLAGRGEFLDVGDDRLPVALAERRIVDHDVFGGDSLGFEERLQDLVGGARIDVIGAGEDPALDVAAFLAHQIFDRRDRLLIGCRSRIEDIARTLLALILDRIEEQPVQFFEDRQHRFARDRGPAAENDGDMILADEFARLFGEERPVRGRIDHDRLDLLAEQPALLVEIVDQHQDRVLEGGLADRHRPGQRMQHADLDRVVGRRCRQSRYQPQPGDRQTGRLHPLPHRFSPRPSVVPPPEIGKNGATGGAAGALDRTAESGGAERWRFGNCLNCRQRKTVLHTRWRGLWFSAANSQVESRPVPRPGRHPGPAPRPHLVYNYRASKASGGSTRDRECGLSFDHMPHPQSRLAGDPTIPSGERRGSNSRS